MSHLQKDCDGAYANLKTPTLIIILLLTCQLPIEDLAHPSIQKNMLYVEEWLLGCWEVID
jgi:hypothetical protein